MSTATHSVTHSAFVTPTKRSTPAKRKCAIDFNDLPKEELRIRGCSDVNCQGIHTESGSAASPAGRDENEQGQVEDGAGQGAVQHRVGHEGGGNGQGQGDPPADEEEPSPPHEGDPPPPAEGDPPPPDEGEPPPPPPPPGAGQGAVQGDPPPPPRVLYCQNCMREEISLIDPESECLCIRSVHSDDLRTTSSRLCHVDLGLDRRYNLCECCYQFLFKHTCPNQKKEASDWKNTYPAFFWSLLAGKDESTGQSFQKYYPQERLWRFVPDKLRPFWVRAIHEANVPDFNFNSHQHCEIISTDGRYPDECTVNTPPSYFVDRTKELGEFENAIKSYNVKSFLEALSPDDMKTMILPDVSCPWGCTEFCFRCSNIPFYLLAQHHLRDVQLNMPDSKCYDELYLIETSRDDYIRLDGEEQDRVLLNGEWSISPTVQVSKDGGLVVFTCRYARYRAAYLF